MFYFADLLTLIKDDDSDSEDDQPLIPAPAKQEIKIVETNKDVKSDQMLDGGDSDEENSSSDDEESDDEQQVCFSSSSSFTSFYMNYWISGTSFNLHTSTWKFDCYFYQKFDILRCYSKLCIHFTFLKMQMHFQLIN